MRFAFAELGKAVWVEPNLIAQAPYTPHVVALFVTLDPFS
jgi:hypothetical protein